jgi:parallel beta-helix repeat protein
MPKPRTLRSVIVASLLLAFAVAVSAMSVNGSGRPVRGPIRIEGDGGFTRANGVVSGSGTILDPYIIAGWQIDATSSDGIVVKNTTASLVIRDVTVGMLGSSRNGVVLEKVASVSVENTSVSFGASGFVVRSSDRVRLSRNSVAQNAGDGIAIFGSSQVVLSGNNITYNRDGVYVQDSSSLLFQGNSISSNTQDGAFLTNVTKAEIEACTFASNRWSGLVLSGASNLSVSVNLVFSNGRDGIEINTAAGVVVDSNTVFANQDGIRLNGVSAAKVELNDLSATRDSGIVVESSHAVSIAHNIVSASGYAGILLGSVSNATLFGNRVSNSPYGMSLLLVSHATVRSNNVTLSRSNGIYFAGTDNMTVEGNNASRNSNGIAVETTQNATFMGNLASRNLIGIYLFRSVRNLVVSNRFEWNGVQAIDDAGPENRWDNGYPAGGNFWTDYIGVDRCTGVNQDVCNDPDGIGDTPYYIDTTSFDRYPLMRPPGSPDVAPFASFLIQPPTGPPGTTFLLNASRSYDVEDNASTLQLRWDFDGDGTWDTAWTHDRLVEHVFSAAGDYRVRLEVRDSKGLTNTTGVLIHVIAPASPPLFVLNSLTASLLLLAAATAALGTLSYYYLRRRRRPVARPSWRLPPKARR